MHCEICKKGPEDGESIFRQNPKGEKGVFRCSTHSNIPVDKTTDELIQIIEEGGDGVARPMTTETNDGGR